MGVIKKTTWFVAMGALLLANAATAAMYKWIDEQGRVQYSQTPPPAGQFKELKPGPPPSQSPEEAEQELQARVQRLDVLQKERDAEKKAKQEKAAQQTQRDALCEQAKNAWWYCRIILGRARGAGDRESGAAPVRGRATARSRRDREGRQRSVRRLALNTVARRTQRMRHPVLSFQRRLLYLLLLLFVCSRLCLVLFFVLCLSSFF